MQDAMALVIAIPSLKLSSQVNDVQVSLLHHGCPTTNHFIFFD